MCPCRKKGQLLPCYQIHTRARAHVQVYIAVKDHPKKSLSLISTENLNHL